MRLNGFLNQTQVEEIHRNALRVLEEVGVEVDHPLLRSRLEAIGATQDPITGRVRFAAGLVENLIQNARKSALRDGVPSISLGCSVYQCLYMDPISDELVPFNEDLLARYFALAENLPGIDGSGLLGLPFVPEDTPARSLPLAERLYSWKHGASPAGSIQLTHLCEPILEMLEIHASCTGKTLNEVFNVGGFLISPLKLGRPECEQMVFFAERGLRMWVGHLPSQGGTAPVTLAGTLVLSLAEQMFIFLLNHAMWGDVSFGLGGMASTIDMRTGVSCYGRPERQRINLAFADIAEFYGCACWGHTGTTDAHTPSCESGVQKAIGVVATALATGHAFIEAGLLGIDEICSPVQMVLDSDLGMCLRALLAEPQIDSVECAFDEIAAVSTGGNHLGTDFTVERFRSCFFEPLTWSNQLTSAWLSRGQRTDLDKARDLVSDLMARYVPHSHISEEEETALRRVIAQVRS